MREFCRPRAHPSAAPDRAGLTLLELSIAIPLLLVAMAMMGQLLLAGRATRESNADNWRASSAAADTLERMHNAPFRELFALYNADPFDDPGGPGTAPGSGFAVDGFAVLEDDPDGLVGEVILPLLNVGSEVAPEWQVREDLDLPELGLPRDLSGDQLVDELDHSADHTFLPVLVRLRWQGAFGPREYRLTTILSELR